MEHLDEFADNLAKRVDDGGEFARWWLEWAKGFPEAVHPLLMSMTLRLLADRAAGGDIS